MASVRFRQNRPKDESGNEKTKPVTILCEYYHKGIQVEKATIIKCLPSRWRNSRIKNDGTSNQYLTELEKTLLSFPINNPQLTVEEHRQAVASIIKGFKPNAETSQKKTLFTALDNFLNQYKSEKEDKTLFKYQALKTRLTDFDKIYPIDFNNLDFNFYDQFKKYLYSIPNPNYRGSVLVFDSAARAYIIRDGVDYPSGDTVGLFDDTVFKYFINLKTFLASCEKRGHKVHPSYKEWEIIKRVYPPIALSLDELEKLESIDIPKKEIALSRDYFTIEARTGARISDIERFNVSDLKESVVDGEAVHTWHYQPVKGSRLRAQKIELDFAGYTAPAYWTLQKHGFRLPKISQAKLNKGIKKACKIAGIDSDVVTERYAGNKKILITGKKHEFISTHTGKKTFITHLAESNFPLAIISQMCGTTIQTIIKHYIGKSDKKVVISWLKSIDKKDESLMRVASS